MVADNLLPMWTIAPNWREPVVERLEWMTDIFSSETGHEQRRAQRLAPRRSIEALYTPVDADRTFFELLLQRLGRNEFMMPLWFDQGIATGVTGSTITVDTVDREFSVGSMALLLGSDPFTFEAFTISALAAGSLTSSVPLVGGWPAGTKVFPLRRGWLDPQSTTPVTNRVSSAQLRFNMDARNDVTGGAESFTLYQGHPLLTHDVDWSQALTNNYEWLSEEFDSEIGLRHVVDTAERAFVMRRYGMLLEGIEEQMAYRRLLYRLEGRAKPVWIPDFSRNIEVVRPSAVGSQIINIRKIGLGYVGGITDDVAHVLIGGNEAVQIDDLGVALAVDEERLLLTAPLGRALAVGEYGSFLHLSRLEQDSVTIEHHTDNEGVARSSLAFREFAGGRAGAASGDWSVPVTAMTAGSCGHHTITFNEAATGFGSPDSLVISTNSGTNITISKPLASLSGGQLLWDAYSPWVSDNAASPPPPVLGRTWNNNFYVFASNGGGETLIYQPAVAANYYTTATEAFNAISALLPITLTGYSQYRIKSISDNNPSDNRGGISLLVQVG